MASQWTASAIGVHGFLHLRLLVLLRSWSFPVCANGQPLCVSAGELLPEHCHLGFFDSCFDFPGCWYVGF